MGINVEENMGIMYRGECGIMYRGECGIMYVGVMWYYVCRSDVVLCIEEEKRYILDNK